MYTPHGLSYNWELVLTYVQTISSGVCFLSYLFIFFAILHMLIYSISGRYSYELNRTYLVIAFCFLFSSLTALMDVVTIWTPLYIEQASVKSILAFVAIWAAFYELPSLPRLLESITRRMRGLETDRSTLLKSIDNQTKYLDEDLRSLAYIQKDESLEPFVQKLKMLTDDIRNLLNSQEYIRNDQQRVNRKTVI